MNRMLTCPKCGNQIEIDARKTGSDVACAKCAATYTIERRGPRREGEEKRNMETRNTTGAEETATRLQKAVKPNSNERGIVPAQPVYSQTYGHDVSPATESLSGQLTTLGRFEILRELGRGSFATVYEAADPHLDRHVAIKTMVIERHDHEAQERYRRETMAVAELRHPNIVGIFETGFQDSLHFIVTELVHGEPFSMALDSLDTRAAVEVVRDIALAVAYAHRKGIIHRDIKPQNVMVDQELCPRLMDFGLAKRTSDATMTTEGSSLGTPAYMAPEQVRGDVKEVGKAADQYGLGAMLYHALTGSPPFTGEVHVVLARVLNQPPKSMRLFDKEIPRDLESVCLKALSKNPADRYANVEQLAADLTKWLHGEPVSVRPLGMLTRVLRWSQREPLVAGLATSVLGVLVLGLTLVSWQWRVATEAKKDADLALGRANVATEQAIEAREYAEEQEKNAREAAELAESRRLALQDQLAVVEKTKQELEAEITQRKLAVDRAQSAESVIEANRSVIEETAEKSQWIDYRNTLQQVDTELAGLRLGAARQLLAATTVEKRGWEWELLTEQLITPHRFTTRPFTKASYSQDGKYVALAHEDPDDDELTIAVHLLETGALVKEWSGAATDFEFNSRDYISIVVISDDNQQRQYSILDWIPRLDQVKSRAIGGRAQSPKLSPNGNRVLYVVSRSVPELRSGDTIVLEHWEYTVRVETVQGELIRSIDLGAGAFSIDWLLNDGLAVWNSDQFSRDKLRYFNIRTGKRMGSPFGKIGASTAVLSPDDDYIMSGVQLIPRRGSLGKPRSLTGLTGLVGNGGDRAWLRDSRPFSADGMRIVGQLDGGIGVWDVNSGKPLFQWSDAQNDKLITAALGPRGAWLTVSSSKEGRVFRVEPSSDFRQLPMDNAAVDIVFDDESQLVSCGGSVYELSNLAVADLPWLTKNPSQLSYMDSSLNAFQVANKSQFRERLVQTQDNQFRPQGYGQIIGLSSDRSQVVTRLLTPIDGGKENDLRNNVNVVRWQSSQVVSSISLGNEFQVYTAGFPVGRQPIAIGGRAENPPVLISAYREQNAKLFGYGYEMGYGDESYAGMDYGGFGYGGMGYSESNVGTAQQTKPDEVSQPSLLIWEIDDELIDAPLELPISARCQYFLSYDAEVVITTNQARAKAWNTSSGQLLWTAELPPAGSIGMGCYAPDGRRLFLPRDNRVFILDADSGATVYSISCDYRANRVVCSPNGRWLAIGCDGEVLIVDAGDRK